MRRLVLLGSLLGAGCGAGKAVVSLTVESGGAIGKVVSLRITASQGGRSQSQSYSQGSEISLPVTLGLVFDKGISGGTHLDVGALDGAGTKLATGTVDVNVEPSKSTSARVILLGTAPPPDMGLGDLGQSNRDIAFALDQTVGDGPLPIPDLELSDSGDMAVMVPPDMAVAIPADMATAQVCALNVDNFNNGCVLR